MTQYLDLTALFESIKFNTGLDILKDATLNIDTDMNIIMYDLYVSNWSVDLLNNVRNVINNFLQENSICVMVETDTIHNTITINGKIELIIRGCNND